MNYRPRREDGMISIPYPLERRPQAPGWAQCDTSKIPKDELEPAVSAWYQAGMYVITSTCIGKIAKMGELGPIWHVSASMDVPGRRDRRRPRGHEVRRMLEAFDLVGAEEDNHTPGVARHFWLPCDPAARTAEPCECKTDEVLVVEPDGYVWTNDPDPERCRGCAHEESLRAADGFYAPCPIHKPAEAARVKAHRLES